MQAALLSLKTTPWVTSPFGVRFDLLIFFWVGFVNVLVLIFEIGIKSAPENVPFFLGRNESILSKYTFLSSSLFIKRESIPPFWVPIAISVIILL